MNWQPIETAPKDGSIILAWCSDAGWPEAVKWWFYHPEHGEELVEGYWGYAEEILNDVTGGADPGFWMPLPEPPNA
jgi:hypothetical protein